MQIILFILTGGVDRCCRVCAGHLPCLGKDHSCQEIQDFCEHDRYSENTMVEDDRSFLACGLVFNWPCLHDREMLLSYRGIIQKKI